MGSGCFFLLIRILRKSSDIKKETILGLLVALFAFLAYANSLGNGFISDDHSVIQHNPVLRVEPLSLFSKIDTTSDTQLLPYYRPLTYLSFWAEYRLHGFNSALMHLVNVLLHAANAFLVYCLARSLLPNRDAALLAGLLFALHPINSEAVNFLSGGRNTLLACFFSLLAFLIHQRSVERGSVPAVFAGAAFFFAGLFSKESGMMILPFIIALEIPRLRKKSSGTRLRAAAGLVLYVAAAGTYLVMRWQTLSGLGIQTGILPGFGEEKMKAIYIIPDLGSRLSDNLYIIPRYLFSLVLPYALSPRYVIPNDFHLYALPLAGGWFIVVGVFLWLLMKGRSRAILFGISWAVVFWLPVSGVFYFSSVTLADRFLYLPAIGIWLVAADRAGFFLSGPGAYGRYGMIAGITVLMILALLTVKRNADWKSDITLFSRSVQQYPENQYGHYNLAAAYVDRRGPGDLENAGRELEAALSLDPSMQDAYTPMGYVKLESGDFEGAVYYYTRALEFFPLNRDARINRAIAYEKLGMPNEALADYRFYLTMQTYNNIPGSLEYAERKVLELSQ